MKTRVFSKKYAVALLGIVFALSGLINASAQGLGLLSRSGEEFSSKVGIASHIYHDNEKEVLDLEEINIVIEEVATVTFINKMGEVVAVLKGDKSVLDDIYQDSISKSYLLSSYGVHEVYLAR
ncbi:MAG TPA: hypothetical protein VK921_08865 [Anditalea sp.]|nr:hypothetical protein [Anditalea sp.]